MKSFWKKFIFLNMAVASSILLSTEKTYAITCTQVAFNVQAHCLDNGGSRKACASQGNAAFYNCVNFDQTYQYQTVFPSVN